MDFLSRQFPTLLSPPLSTLAGLAALARACVGNDSGFCHLAAAVGAPTLALFSPTNPVHFAPLGPRAHTLSAPSMEAIPLEQVLLALNPLM
jgi:ADP-heptose:LPS heptosyltransferase